MAGSHQSGGGQGIPEETLHLDPGQSQHRPDQSRQHDSRRADQPHDALIDFANIGEVERQTGECPSQDDSEHGLGGNRFATETDPQTGGQNQEEDSQRQDPEETSEAMNGNLIIDGSTLSRRQ